MIKFEAEIKETKAKKLVSGDMEYSVRLVGSNPVILSLGTIDAQTLVDVTITPQ